MFTLDTFVLVKCMYFIIWISWWAYRLQPSPIFSLLCFMFTSSSWSYSAQIWSNLRIAEGRCKQYNIICICQLFNKDLTNIATNIIVWQLNKQTVNVSLQNNRTKNIALIMPLTARKYSVNAPCNHRPTIHNEVYTKLFTPLFNVIDSLYKGTDVPTEVGLFLAHRSNAGRMPFLLAPMTHMIPVTHITVFQVYFQCNHHHHHHHFFFWLAPPAVCSTTHSQQPSERSVLSHAASAWWDLPLPAAGSSHSLISVLVSALLINLFCQS